MIGNLGKQKTFLFLCAHGFFMVFDMEKQTQQGSFPIFQAKGIGTPVQVGPLPLGTNVNQPGPESRTVRKKPKENSYQGLP
jgi:hypothetical protein